MIFMGEDTILEMKNICKNFGGVSALKGVDLSVKKGEVHALMGENGAGKSTLMKILIGIHAPDKGEIYIKGKPVRISNTKDAISLGISMIYQELNPVPHMTVADNIFLGREPVSKKTRLVDFKKMHADAKAYFESINVDIEPNERVSKLSVAKVQLVEITKAVSFNSEIIIMDEPTSALSTREIERLFDTIRLLREKGVTIIYISHKMDEIFKICDRVTVLRDGSYVGTESISGIDMNKLIKMMVGREITEMFPKQEAQIGDVIFEVKGLTRKGEFEDISFCLRKGEILGIAGLMGAGRTEMVESIFGMRKPDRGEINVNGKKVAIKLPEDAIRNRIAMVPEDRKNFGLVLKLSVKDNVIISFLKKCMGRFLLSRKKEEEAVKGLVETLQIKVGSISQVCSSLSGGNQQKVVLSKCLFADPEILILDEPTRGIDVKTKAEIHFLMSKLARMGKSIIMISSEMPEIIGMSDRILVLHEGRITGELGRNEADQERIMALAMGKAL